MESQKYWPKVTKEEKNESKKPSVGMWSVEQLSTQRQSAKNSRRLYLEATTP